MISAHAPAAARPAAPLPVWSNDQIADYLTRGFWADMDVLRDGGTLSFELGASRRITVDLGALDASEKRLAAWALEAWSDVTGITFTSVSSGAEITFRSDQAGAFGGPTMIRGHEITRAQVNVDRDWVASHGSDIGSYALFTYVHEIGHALGLGHAGFYDGGMSIEDGKLFANDSQSLTVMSYFEGGAPDDRSGHSMTPMAADILAIRALYGSAAGTRTGDTAYGVNGDAGGYVGALMEALVKGHEPFFFTIVDDGGRNRIDFSNDSHAQDVSLAGGSQSTVYGGPGVMAIAQGTLIHDFSAGRGDDIVRGNLAANILSGNAGHDRLSGAGGDDVLSGGSGNDTLLGGAGLDLLSGGTGNDRLDGGAGRDRLVGGAGADNFVFLPADSSAGLQADRIMDFRAGDRIDLTGFDLSLGGSAFSGVAGELVIRDFGSVRTLAADLDGDARADLELRVIGAWAGSSLADVLLL